jgi:hypothetical protein
VKEIQTTKKQMADHDEMDDDTLYSTLAVQCAHLCESLTDIKSVLEEPNIEISSNAEDLLKDLSVLLESSEAGDSSSDNESHRSSDDESHSYSGDGKALSGAGAGKSCEAVRSTPKNEKKALNSAETSLV